MNQCASRPIRASAVPLVTASSARPKTTCLSATLSSPFNFAFPTYFLNMLPSSHHLFHRISASLSRRCNASSSRAILRGMARNNASVRYFGNKSRNEWRGSDKMSSASSSAPPKASPKKVTHFLPSRATASEPIPFDEFCTDMRDMADKKAYDVLVETFESFFPDMLPHELFEEQTTNNDGLVTASQEVIDTWTNIFNAYAEKITVWTTVNLIRELLNKHPETSVLNRCMEWLSYRALHTQAVDIFSKSCGVVSVGSHLTRWRSTKRGAVVTPNLVSMHCVIDALLKLERYTEVESLLNRFCTEGGVAEQKLHSDTAHYIEPDQYLIKARMIALTKQHKYQEFIDYFNSLPLEVQQDPRNISTKLDALIQNEQIEDAVELLNYLNEHPERVSNSIVKLIVYDASPEARLDIMLKYYSPQNIEKYPLLQVDGTILWRVIQPLARQGELEALLAVLNAHTTTDPEKENRSVIVPPIHFLTKLFAVLTNGDAQERWERDLEGRKGAGFVADLYAYYAPLVRPHLHGKGPVHYYIAKLYFTFSRLMDSDALSKEQEKMLRELFVERK